MRRALLLGARLALVAGAAACLLLPRLGNQSLWQDEAQTALIARTILSHGIPLGSDGRNVFSQEDGAEYGPGYVWKWHPWLPFYLLAAFFGAFGASTFVARLPFALFGIATVVLAYLGAGRLWTGRWRREIAAGLLLLCVPFLLLARQCRYYSPAIFFSLLGLLSYHGLTERRRGSAMLLFLSGTLLFHTNFVSCAALLAATILHCLVCRRDLARSLLLPAAATVLVNLPWLFWISDLDYARRYGSPGTAAFFPALANYSWLAARHCFGPVVLGLAAVLAAARGRRAFPGRPRARASLALLLLFIGVTVFSQAVFNQPPLFRNLAPIIPACLLVATPLVVTAIRWHAAAGAALAVLLVAASPFPHYLYEITHDFEGPIDGIVRHLKSHGRDGDVVAITYEDLPLKFYTKLRVVGGLTGEDLSAAKNADWVILRNYSICDADRAVRLYFETNLSPEQYRAVTIDSPDTPFQNRESPEEHRYRTAAGEAPVVLWQRIAPRG